MPTAVVTGASSGLGVEYADQLAALGYDLLLVGRDQTALEQTAQRVRTHGRSAEILRADLTVDRDLKAVEERVAGTDIDFLVNNAGTGTPGAFLTSDAAVEQRMLDLNVTAVMRLCHAALPQMVDRGRGCILNVASVAAFVPSDTGPGYSASKAYVSMFTESLATAVAGTGVRVCAVCPGFVRTNFHPRLEMDTSWIPSWAWLRSEDVVRDSLLAIRAGKTRSVPSAKYKAAMALVAATPRPLLRRVLAAATKSTSRA